MLGVRVGSNILLHRIPDAGRIGIVEGGEIVPRDQARDKFQQTAFLSRKDADARGWTTAVMDCIDELDLRPGERFELADVYSYEDELAEMYPENQHVRAKIRQQMQVLRDEGIVEFLGSGEYRLRFVDDRELA